jgi:hypothetical protein
MMKRESITQPGIPAGGVLASMYLLAGVQAMTRNLCAFVTAGVFLFALSASSQTAGVNACDLTKDGVVNNADVDAAVSMSLGPSSGCTANIIGQGVCNVVVVQRVANAITGACVVGNPRSVELNWVASVTPAVVGYRVYRGTASGGPYTELTPTPVAALTYTDTAPQSGRTYFYVVTAVDGGNNASVHSDEAVAVVP